MFELEADDIFSADAEMHVAADGVDGVGHDVTLHEVAESGIP